MAGQSVLQLWALFLTFVTVFVVARAIAKWFRRRDISHVRISEATIARDLIPKLSKVGTSGATFFITGGDGYSLLKFGIYPWRRFIKRVVREGGTIKYLLTNVRESDQKKLTRFKQNLEKGAGGGIEFCFVSTDRAEESDRALVNSLVTFHPSLIEFGEQRLMWIEDYHPAQSTCAYSCEFVPPERAAGDPRFDRYKSDLTYLFSKYSLNAAAAPVLSH